MDTGARAVEPVLRAELYRPQPEADLVDRSRLIESMNSGLEVPLTWCLPRPNTMA